MARKARKAKTVAPAEDQGSIFDHMAKYAASLSPEEDDKKVEPVDSAKLIERIAYLEGQMKAAEATNRLLMAEPPVAKPAALGPQDVKFTLDGLPDVVEDHAGYQKALQERIASFVQAQVAAVKQDVNSQTEAQTRSQRLHKQFFDAHPEWEDHQEVVGLVARQVAEEAVASGINPERYMTLNAQQYIADVNKRLTERYGALIADADESETDDAKAGLNADPRHGTPLFGEPAPDGRTAGIAGGVESGGKPAPGKAAGKDMIGDLQDLQMKTGFW